MTFPLRQTIFTLLKNALNVPVTPKRTMGYINNRSQYWLERVGHREMVGYGHNGTPAYVDRPDFPFSALRYKETSPEIQALFEKQKGNWKLLSKKEKKELYRANFCQTFAEFEAPTGEWMEVLGYSLMISCLGVWLYMLVKLFVYRRELPITFKPSWKRAQLRRQIDLKVDPIEGMCSDWDYERNDWKVIRWRTPPNPFIRCPDDED